MAIRNLHPCAPIYSDCRGKKNCPPLSPALCTASQQAQTVMRAHESTKKYTKTLTPVFGEALCELQAEGINVPEDFLPAAWVPIGKVASPTATMDVRDLQLPNEDRKVLSRMVSFLLDEAGAGSLHGGQQAMFSGSDIMRNAVGLDENIMRPWSGGA